MEPVQGNSWLPDIQVMTARYPDKNSGGLFLAAKGGHNEESHNHNDVGNFIIYLNGNPAIIDVGVETYRRQTFSDERYTIWTMQSAYHNCPTVDGQMELAGREYAASSAVHHADDRVAELSLNIENAFGPEAGIDTWKRTYRLDRTKNAVEIREDYSLKKPAGVITLTLMTAGKPTQKAPGVVDLAGKAVARYDPQVFRPKIEQIALKDGRLRSAWGDTLWRILLVAGKPPRKAAWTTTITQS